MFFSVLYISILNVIYCISNSVYNIYYILYIIYNI